MEKNNKFTFTCALSLIGVIIGGTSALVKDCVESQFKISWKRMAKSFGRGAVVGATMGAISGSLACKKEKKTGE
jgi:hypothetical protein